MAIQARKAQRFQVKIKMALIGPSGAGKTYSALRVANGIGGRTLLLNTEGDRGYLYADQFDYDIVDLQAPYTPERYIEIIEFAEREKYDVLIIDSGSHEWSGRGGLLDVLDNLPGNSSFNKWGKLTPRHNAFVDKILYSKLHVITCLRGKDRYVLEENEKGKQAPKKVGLGAEQRDNYEYEMMLSLMIDQQNHVATAVKDNTGLFSNRYEVLSESHGRELKEWSESGVSAPPSPAPQPAPQQQRQQTAQPPAQSQQSQKPPENAINYLQAINTAGRGCGITTPRALKDVFLQVTGNETLANRNQADYEKVLAYLQSDAAKMAAPAGQQTTIPEFPA